LNTEVERSGNGDIRTIFKTLLSQKKSIQQELADFCNVDKSYISKVVNGIYTPDLIMKLKIAEFFDVDTRVIWRDIKVNVRGEDKKW
jgi:transcriptional regulator with XRE-family HTH domain